MLLVYENKNTGLSSEWKEPVHVPPHLHEAIEVVYVTDGEVELGVGPELFHMDEGDFAIIFPNVIHHYQVFGQKKNKVIYLYLDPKLFPSYYKELQNYSPENPVVKKRKVHPDVVNAIKYLAEITDGNPMLIKAYAQMIVRLNYAVAELENSMDSITNICLDCGFESQRTFNRVFKDRYKITPREYRKRMEHDK